jgi:hypothetical protein
MNKEEILEEIGGRLEIYLPEYELEEVFVDTNCRNNGVLVMGLSIRAKGYRMVPCIYADAYLPEADRKGEYREEEIDFERLTMRVAEDYRYTMEHFTPDVRQMFQKDQIETRLVLNLVNYKENAEKFLNSPYFLLEDLAVQICWLVNCGKYDGTVLLTNDIVEEWDIPMEELRLLALQNTARLFQPVIRPLDEVMQEMMTQCRWQTPVPPSPFYMLTNHRHSYGATVLLYDNMMEKLSELVKGSYYIIPCSVHELLILPECFCEEPEILLDMVKDVNDNFIDTAEILSYSIYYYDQKEKELRTIMA